MGEALAILAAVLFAAGTVLQQKGTLTTAAGEDDPRFLLQILHRPVWLAGAVLQSTGWVVQAMALDRASLVAVQSLTALSLVLPCRWEPCLTDQHIGRRELSGATLTLVGIVVFISAGQPQGGTSHPAASAWWTACLVTGALVAILFLVGRRFTGAAKALTFGAAAGLGYGLQAAVTKTFVTEIGSGVAALLTSWSVYVLIISAVSGFALQQSALKTGVLAPAMASSNSVTLFSSVILGITVYGESLSKGGSSHVGPAVVGLVIALFGIALLGGLRGPAVFGPGGARPLPRHMSGAPPTDGVASGRARLIVHLVATVDIAGTWWQYLVLFVAVAASWAGVPFIGATALGAAGVAASQGKLNLALVVGVSTLAGEVGGLIGYAVGNHWGRELLERPGRHQAGTPAHGRAGRAGLREVGSPGGVLHPRHRVGHGENALRTVRALELARLVRVLGVGRRELLRPRKGRHGEHLAPRLPHAARRARRRRHRDRAVRPPPPPPDRAVLHPSTG